LEYGALDVEHDILDDHHDHDHDDDHPDCECITGYTTDDLDIACNDTETLNEIQQYLLDNECDSYCHTHDDVNELHLDHGSSEEEGWICFQAFSLVNQYHDYCPSGAINESLFHHYLDVCPDCRGATHYDEDAVDCDMTLNCTDGDAQLAAIEYVNDYCILTCEGNCTEVWQTVEGYHQICDHDDLSEEFDTIFDSLAFTETACGDDIHCNVVGADEDANCSAHENEWYYEHLLEYGVLDLDDDIFEGDDAIRFASGFGVIVASLYNMLLQ